IMKKIITFCLAVVLLGMQVLPVSALSQSESKQAWYSARQARFSADSQYRQAKVKYASDKSKENEQELIKQAKKTLNAVLDEAEAWLNWKNEEAKADIEAPSDIKENIEIDVNNNLAKIENLKKDVDGIDNMLGVGVVFLKMVGSYAELLTDVARNTGLVWVHAGGERIKSINEFEVELRKVAKELDDNTDIIKKLDIAKSESKTAQDKVNTAKSAYEKVKLPGMPLIKFAEGNNYLRQARVNLLNAHAQLEHVYNLILIKVE
ncbi:MAG: hypothetical protein ABIH87_03095, partial [bacterium]